MVALRPDAAEGEPGDDLDLLVVHDGFPREMQFATESGGITAAIVCLRASPGEAREREWSAAGPGAAWMMGMVRSARVVHDPAGQLTESAWV